MVMYHFYRWFPSSKVVFMAPTKPLVTQQMEACSQVMGIPQPHRAKLTGSTQAITRKEIGSRKRVLLLTPQVMLNELPRGACPAADVKCLVVDEAHKALGNDAYCQVVNQFRDGGDNTLVSTCVGEEGLNIGEVDLIICFDAQESPIPLIQGMGRTGHKHQGRIVVILAEGHEDRGIQLNTEKVLLTHTVIAVLHVTKIVYEKSCKVYECSSPLHTCNQVQL